MVVAIIAYGYTSLYEKLVSEENRYPVIFKNLRIDQADQDEILYPHLLVVGEQNRTVTILN